MNALSPVPWLLKAYVLITLFLGLAFAIVLLVCWLLDLLSVHFQKKKDR